MNKLILAIAVLSLSGCGGYTEADCFNLSSSASRYEFNARYNSLDVPEEYAKIEKDEFPLKRERKTILQFVVERGRFQGGSRGTVYLMCKKGEMP